MGSTERAAGEGQRKGQKNTAANGSEFQNLGESEIQCLPGNGQKRSVSKLPQ